MGWVWTQKIILAHALFVLPEHVLDFRNCCEILKRQHLTVLFGKFYKACGISQSSGRVICSIKALQKWSGKGGSCRVGNLWKGRTICFQQRYVTRPGNKADTLIRNTHVKNYPCDFIKIQQEKWGWNSPQLISQKISHMSFVGHSSQVSCCTVLSIWRTITLMIQNTVNPCYMIIYQYDRDSLNF